MSEVLDELKKQEKAIVDWTKSHDRRLADMQARLDEFEAGANRPSNPAAGGSREDREHREAFSAWIRKPRDHEANSRLQSVQKAIHAEVKTTVDGDGGYAVPEVISRNIEKQLRELNPLRQYCRVETVSSSDFKALVDVNGIASGWVGETDTRSETGTPGLEEVAPTFGTVYAYPKWTEEAALDMFFDIERWLSDSAAEEFAIQEGVAFIEGNGTKKPTGFLNGTPVTTGDKDSPARAFGTLEYVPTGVADAFPNDRTGSPAGDPVDVLKSVKFALQPRYRMGPNVAWAMNNATLEVISKWKDVDGRYIWQESMQADEPDRLLGFPVILLDGMPDIGANAFPVAFGNWKKGYLIADQAGLRATFDPYTTPGYQKLYVRKRVGGKVLDSNAIKLVKIAAS